MTENEINITDMIKALQCVASQDADGDCYCDHFNAHLTCEQFGDNARLDEKHMSCGGILKDTQSCPYSQKTYGVCYEDGELWWLKDIVSILEEIQQYREYKEIFESHFSEEALKLLSNKEEFGKWLERGRWIAKKCDEINRELEQYRAIGTVEQLEWCKDASHWKELFKEKLEQYEAIGTLEEFKALKEKNTPYKPKEYEDRYYACKCDNILLPKWRKYPTELMPKSEGLPHCMACGQKLDWQ